jgi:hypothetical protein
MAQQSSVGFFVVLWICFLPAKFKYSIKYSIEISAYQLTFVGCYNRHETAFHMKSQGQFTILLKIPEGVLHLVSVSVLRRTWFNFLDVFAFYILVLKKFKNSLFFFCQLLLIGNSLIFCILRKIRYVYIYPYSL